MNLPLTRFLRAAIACALVPLTLFADDTATLQGMFDLAASQGMPVVIPAGLYQVYAPLHVAVSVFMDGVTIRAMQAMPEVLDYGANIPVAGLTLAGGTIDANNLATRAVWMHRMNHVTVRDVTFDNALYGLHLGDVTATCPPCQYEIIARNLWVKRSVGPSVKNSVGILIEKTSTDNNLDQGVVTGYETGMRLLSGGNFISNFHVWNSGSQGLMKWGFNDYGNGNKYTNCMPDNTYVYGFWLHQFNTIIDGARLFNSLPGSQSMIGIRFDQYNPSATVVNSNFFAEFANIPMAQDMIGATEAFTWSGNNFNNVSTHNPSKLP
jgi:hypothetical protein